MLVWVNFSKSTSRKKKRKKNEMNFPLALNYYNHFDLVGCNNSMLDKKLSSCRKCYNQVAENVIIELGP